MRIISLVPNGTEILFALGAGDSMVGVSHECDYPPAARTRPILTGSALSPGMSAAEVDAAVAAQMAKEMVLARQAALEQDHGASGVAASKEERSGRTHDAAADHDHIGSVISQRRALL